MGSIQQLPGHLINQIAAGEVVERPASVVKELIENALDAGAKKIILEINGAGDSFIRITDDGSGMDRSDAVLAFERHATSKIKTAEDLFNIHTLGFRGEAIASIAAVSYITLQTKKRGEMEGTLVVAEGGKISKIQPVGVPEGTQIEIQNLFFNTPARKKYLKNDSTEYQHIMDTITGISLTFPHVSFRVVHDNKLVFDLPAVDDEFIRIRTLFGKNIADELIPVFYGHSQIQLKGYIGKPVIARGNRNFQYLFINHREVKSHVLGYAVKQSYSSLLPKEKYPVFFLYFDISPELVDVNVHPRKSEVRFRDEREIFSATTQACKKALTTHVLAPNISHDAPVNYYEERKAQPLNLNENKNDYQPTVDEVVAVGAGSTAGSAPVPATAGEIFQGVMDFSQGFEAKERKNMGQLVALGQLSLSYILCQQGNSLVIVDQHAAHERIRYTEIFAEFLLKNLTTQTLLTPVQLELSTKEIALFEALKELFQKLGFEIEPFGGKTYSIHAVPAHLAQKDLQKAFTGLLDEFSEGKNDVEEQTAKALTYLACRSAVKFGDPLSQQEQTAIIEKLQTLDQPYTCPHGRPTMIAMNAEELKKRFGRDYSML